MYFILSVGTIFTLIINTQHWNKTTVLSSIYRTTRGSTWYMPCMHTNVIVQRSSFSHLPSSFCGWDPVLDTKAESFHILNESFSWLTLSTETPWRREIWCGPAGFKLPCTLLLARYLQELTMVHVIAGNICCIPIPGHFESWHSSVGLDQYRSRYRIYNISQRLVSLFWMTTWVYQCWYQAKCVNVGCNIFPHRLWCW
jgi:hypothetical protein